MNNQEKIAKENVKRFAFTGSTSIREIMRSVCTQHKQTCQDWLEFLEVNMFDFMNLNGACHRIMNKKITELKSAIKIYLDAGI